MVDFSLRPAVDADLPLIREWVRDNGINPLGLDWERFTVAETSRDQVIGCVQLKPHRDGTLELASLVVAENWRGRGVARALVEHVLADHSGSANHNGSLYVMCRSGLGPLYEKFGFRELEEEEMPRYYRRITKLAGIINRFRDKDEYLMIMRQE
jgi:N-acetylglutamate synthase-like GNAT family acetyltransferase